MIKTLCFFNVARSETHLLKRYKRKPNTSFEYENFPDIVFRGKIANTPEQKSFRIQKGISGSNDSVYIMASNLPSEIDINDKIEFLGKVYTVQSVGYYYDQARYVNAGILDDEYIISRCPKGIVIG